MSDLSGLWPDETTARMVLSMIADPDDFLTTDVVYRVGGVEALRVLASEGPVPALDEAGARLWRARLTPRLTTGLLTAVESYREQDFTVVIPSDDLWPPGLQDLGPRQPYLLWAQGATSLLRDPISDRVTITGARACTSYGETVTTDLAAELAGGQRTIVAGGSFGIETAAHRAALTTSGDTIAVLPTGIDIPYPRANEDMLESINTIGLLVSELPPGVQGRRQHFLARNRIMAALSGTTVVVEASARSGSLHVAAEAVALRRPVGAVPGPVTSAVSYGTNHLLRQRTASVVTCAEDVGGLVNGEPRTTVPHTPSFSPPAGTRRPCEPPGRFL